MTAALRMLTLIALFATAVTLTACPLEPSPGSSDADADGGDADALVDGDTGDSAPEATYHYVLIEDLEDPETSSPTHTAGVDVFGVQLSSGGETSDASQVHACNFGDGDNTREKGREDVPCLQQAAVSGRPWLLPPLLPRCPLTYQRTGRGA